MSVHQLDATPLRTTGTGQLPLSSKFSNEAQQGFILPILQILSLIAMGLLCNNGCKVVLSKNKLSVIKNREVILRRTRNCSDNLWDIPIEKAELD